ncbi:hypothetical protein JCM9279_000676 [Rhodotorula babjevae]
MSSNPYARRPKPTYPAAARPSADAASYAAAYPQAYPGAPAASTSAYPAAPAAAYPQQAGYDPSFAQQSSIYTPDAAKTPAGRAVATVGNKGKARTTVLRKGGGEVWEDQSLLEWDPKHFRLFIGDLDPAISDDLFQQAFGKWPSFVKSKVIRDKYTNKGKGFGFVSYSDPEDFLKAWKEMNGKYVGTRPVTIKKATSGVQSVAIGARKAQTLEAKHAQKTGTVPYERANADDAGHKAVPGEKGYGPQRSRKQYIRR